MNYIYAFIALWFDFDYHDWTCFGMRLIEPIVRAIHRASLLSRHLMWVERIWRWLNLSLSFFSAFCLLLNWFLFMVSRCMCICGFLFSFPGESSRSQVITGFSTITASRCGLSVLWGGYGYDCADLGLPFIIFVMILIIYGISMGKLSRFLCCLLINLFSCWYLSSPPCSKSQKFLSVPSFFFVCALFFYFLLFCFWTEITKHTKSNW